MPTIDFPSGVTATNPTKLVGANPTDPASASVGSVGLAALNAATTDEALAEFGGQTSFVRRYSDVEHFLNGVTGIGQGLAAANTGGTQAVQASDTRNGVVLCSTGVAVTADRISCISSTAASSISLGYGISKNAWVFAPALALADGTNQGFIRVGFFDNNANTATVDGAFFRSTDGGNYFAVCRSNSVETAVDTGILPVVGTYVIACVTVNVDATSVLFELYTSPTDGSPVSLLDSRSITTNIPTGAGRQVGHGISVQRVTAAAVAQGLFVDISYLGLDHPTTLPF